MKEFWKFIQYLVILAIVLTLLFTLVLGVKMAPNNDMSPRVSAGDLMFYYRIDKQAQPQDVIVVKKNGTEYIGRVIATGGDSVEVTKEENLIINGNRVIEDEIFYTTPQYEGFVDYPVTLAEDEFFVLCDKREGGEDSRYYGPVKKSEIKGTVIGFFRRGGL